MKLQNEVVIYAEFQSVLKEAIEKSSDTKEFMPTNFDSLITSLKNKMDQETTLQSIQNIKSNMTCNDTDTIINKFSELVDLSKYKEPHRDDSFAKAYFEKIKSYNHIRRFKTPLQSSILSLDKVIHQFDHSKLKVKLKKEINSICSTARVEGYKEAHTVVENSYQLHYRKQLYNSTHHTGLEMLSSIESRMENLKKASSYNSISALREPKYLNKYKLKLIKLGRIKEMESQ